jgi:hypothetical protein
MTCQEPLRLLGDPRLPAAMRRAYHVATGTETGAGGHAALPAPENPLLRAEADRIERDLPAFRVSARFGIFRACWRPDLLPPGAGTRYYTASTPRAMRNRLRAVLRGTRVTG